jgi:hypothetical protein
VRLREIRADARIFLKILVTEDEYVGNDAKRSFTDERVLYHREHRGTRGRSDFLCVPLCPSVCPVVKDFDVFITKEDIDHHRRDRL